MKKNLFTKKLISSLNNVNKVVLVLFFFATKVEEVSK